MLYSTVPNLYMSFDAVQCRTLYMGSETVLNCDLYKSFLALQYRTLYMSFETVWNISRGCLPDLLVDSGGELLENVAG